MEFRVSSGNPESRLRIPSGTRNIPGSTGNVGRSKAARCLRIVKISCVGQGIHLVLQILNLSQELPPSGRISSPVAWTIHQFLVVLLHLPLRNKFFSILQFLANLLRDFLGRVCFSFQILRVNSSFLFEPDLPIGSPDTAPLFVIRVLDCFHEGQYQKFFVPNF